MFRHYRTEQVFDTVLLICNSYCAPPSLVDITGVALLHPNVKNPSLVPLYERNPWGWYARPLFYFFPLRLVFQFFLISLLML